MQVVSFFVYLRVCVLYLQHHWTALVTADPNTTLWVWLSSSPGVFCFTALLCKRWPSPIPALTYVYANCAQLCSFNCALSLVIVKIATITTSLPLCHSCNFSVWCVSRGAAVVFSVAQRDAK